MSACEKSAQWNTMCSGCSWDQQWKAAAGLLQEISEKRFDHDTCVHSLVLAANLGHRFLMTSWGMALEFTFNNNCFELAVWRVYQINGDASQRILVSAESFHDSVLTNLPGGLGSHFT